MSRSWFTAGLGLYLFVLLVLFPLVIGVPMAFTFGSDAVGYSTGAINLLKSGFYTFDGVHAFVDREPVMSFFLVPIYFFFGVEQPIGLYIVQSVMLFLCAWWFCREFTRVAGERSAGIAFVLLLTSGSVIHTVFSAYRECLVLSFFLCFVAMYFSSRRLPAVWKSMLMGVLLGLIIWSYYSFIFLPLFLIPLWLIERGKMKECLLVILVSYLTLVPWALRNYSYDGRLRVIDNRRSAVMWYVRGEQAEQVHGLEPLWCLWSEYVSRDWTGRSPACSYNGLMHTRWPDGFDLQADYGDVAGAGKAKIIAHFPSYLSFSVFEILELHIPYLGGGWSGAYNIYAALSAAVMYAGFFVGVFFIRRKSLAIFFVIIFYNTAVFTLTDATPRYLLPVIFCYAALAGVGYNAGLLKLSKRS